MADRKAVPAQGHPSPTAARLLRPRPVVLPRAQLGERGVALPPVLASPSPAAAVARAVAVAAHASAGALGTLPVRVVDQQDVQCCVSCALSGAMEVLQGERQPLSPMFHYHVTRFHNNGADATGRLFLDRGIGTLGVQGICREHDHPSLFTAAGVVEQPTVQALRDGNARRLVRKGLLPRYREVSGTSRATEIRRLIRDGQPVVVTFTLPEGYPDRFLNARNEWLVPPSRPTDGRHCVLVVAYDDLRGAVQVMDSQGTAMFDRGLWWMGYRILDGRLVHQAFAFK